MKTKDEIAIILCVGGQGTVEYRSITVEKKYCFVPLASILVVESAPHTCSFSLSLLISQEERISSMHHHFKSAYYIKTITLKLSNFLKIPLTPALYTSPILQSS